MPASVVLVGHEDDEHCDVIEKALRDRATVEVSRLSLRDLPGKGFGWSPEEGLRTHALPTRPTAGLWRRLGSPQVESYDERFAHFVERESRDALVGALCAAGTQWVTHPATLWQAELKVVQLHCAHELGLPVPRTLVTNDSRQAREFARSYRVVAKPVRYGLLGGTPEPLVAWTARVDAESLRDLEGPPVILQEEVPAVAHLRVVTVGDDAFVARLEADELDWREEPENHERFKAVPDREQPELRRQSLTLARELRLGFSAQDWIETSDGLFFLEANPSGQWLFLDPAFDGRLLDAMTGLLESLAGRGRDR